MPLAQVLQARDQDGQHQGSVLGGRPQVQSAKTRKPGRPTSGKDPLTAGLGKVDQALPGTSYDAKNEWGQTKRPLDHRDQENGEQATLGYHDRVSGAKQEYTDSRARDMGKNDVANHMATRED